MKNIKQHFSICMDNSLNLSKHGRASENEYGTYDFAQNCGLATRTKPSFITWRNPLPAPLRSDSEDMLNHPSLSVSPSEQMVATSMEEWMLCTMCSKSVGYLRAKLLSLKSFKMRTQFSNGFRRVKKTQPNNFSNSIFNDEDGAIYNS